jgi:hypothetical protein
MFNSEFEAMRWILEHHPVDELKVVRVGAGWVSILIPQGKEECEGTKKGYYKTRQESIVELASVLKFALERENLRELSDPFEA